MDTLLQDLRQAARRLCRAPGFTFVAVLTLALGIGGNAAVLTALEALLLRPLPYADPDRLVLVQQTDPRVGDRPVAPANFLDWRERARSFEGLAAFEVVGRTLLGRETPQRLAVGIVSTNFFDLLGVAPLRGRTFGPPSDGPPGGRARPRPVARAVRRRRVGRGAGGRARRRARTHRRDHAASLRLSARGRAVARGEARRARGPDRSRDGSPAHPRFSLPRRARPTAVRSGAGLGPRRHGPGGGPPRHRVSRRKLGQRSPRDSAVREPARRSAAGPRPAARSGGLRPADRLRKRCQSSPRPRRVPTAGAGGASRAGGEPWPPLAPAHDGGPAPRRSWRGGGPRLGIGGTTPARRSLASHPASPRGTAPVRAGAGALDARSTRLHRPRGPGARPGGGADRRSRGPSLGGAGSPRRPRGAPRARAPRRGRGRGRGRARERRGFASQQPLATAACAPGLRARRRPLRPAQPSPRPEP